MSATKTSGVIEIGDTYRLGNGPLMRCTGVEIEGNARIYASEQVGPPLADDWLQQLNNDPSMFQFPEKAEL